MQIADASLLQLLQAFEVELHSPSARSDANRLDVLLHENFREFGRSGAFYANADILSLLTKEAQHPVVVADRIKLRRLGEFVALLTYRSAHQLPDRSLHRFTLRSSVWEHTALGWQMSFHQGTPTAPYEPIVQLFTP
jgi:hypothetical protein